MYRRKNMSNEIYYIGANDEHGVNPPTPGKRSPIVPGLNRTIYENEFNRASKNKFIEALMRNDFSVFDVKPEMQDVSINERIRRINRQNLTLLVTFAYNAIGTEFSNASGVEVYYSTSNPKASESQRLSNDIYSQLIQGTPQNGRGVKTLDVGVLSNVNCVSSLIEAGFMTNLREVGLMINPLFQTEVGEETCRGVSEYLNATYNARDDLSSYQTIRDGASNNFVFLLQFILNQLGYSLLVDGKFGRNTDAAVKDFQSKNNLSVDGIVGPNTWKTLLTLPQYPIVRRGDRGNYVRFLQQLLESKLIPVGNIDGVFGIRTENAVKSFQQRQGLVVDGIVGPNTWSELTNLQ